MGLNNIMDAEMQANLRETEPTPDVKDKGQSWEERADLDAMKGKGKGGKNDGKCNTCGGDGHFMRDCPNTGSQETSNIECHGCHGKGHYKTACPTANPHLKGGGKGGGGWQTKGGGGKSWEKVVEKVRAKAVKEKAKANCTSSTHHFNHQAWCKDSGMMQRKGPGEEAKKIPGTGVGTRGEEAAETNMG